MSSSFFNHIKGGETIKKIIIVISALLVALIFSGSVAAANTTTDDEIWYNTPAGEGPAALYAYNTTSNTTRLVTTLQKTYGDIAWGPDGNLYGVTFYYQQDTIDLINTETGQGTIVKNVRGVFNSMASDDMGWLYIGGESEFQRYNIYSGVLEDWIDTADHGIVGESTGDSAFVNDDFYATYYNNTDHFLIKITGLDEDHAVTAGTIVSVLMNNIWMNAYGLTRGSDNDLYFTASGQQGYAIYRISLADNTITDVADVIGEPYGAASRIIFLPEENNTNNTTVNAVAMQETGVPIVLLVLAILAVFSGLVGSKRE